MADVSGLHNPYSIVIKNAEMWVCLPDRADNSGDDNWIPVGGVKKGAGSISVTGISKEFYDAFIEGEENTVKRIRTGESGGTIKAELSEITAFTTLLAHGMDPNDDVSWDDSTDTATASVGGRLNELEMQVKLVLNDKDGTNVLNVIFYKCATMTSPDFGFTMTEETTFPWELNFEPDHANQSGKSFVWEFIIDSTNDVVDTGVVDSSANASTLVDAALFDTANEYQWWYLTITAAGDVGDADNVDESRIIMSNDASGNVYFDEPLPATPLAGATFTVWRPSVRIHE